MSFFIGPELTKSGLVASFDIANAKSYAGSGTIVNDLWNRNANELTLQESFYKTYDPIVADYIIPNSPQTSFPTYSSSNYGTLTFDGTGNALKFNTPTLGSTVSIEVWARLGTNYSGNMFISFGSYNIWCENGGLGYHTSNNDLYGISSASVSSLGLVNQWKQYVFEMRTDVSYSNNKIYVNTVSQTLSQQQGTELSANRNFNTVLGRISSWSNVSGYEMPLTLSLVRIYNRALTTTEISDSFRLTRNRFSI